MRCVRLVLSTNTPLTIARMKRPSWFAVLYASTLLSLIAAKALLAVFDASVILGQTYEVEWLSDEADVSRHQTLIYCSNYTNTDRMRS